jgi:hypothetical protein
MLEMLCNSWLMEIVIMAAMKSPTQLYDLKGNVRPISLRALVDELLCPQLIRFDRIPISSD